MFTAVLTHLQSHVCTLPCPHSHSRAFAGTQCHTQRLSHGHIHIHTLHTASRAHTLFLTPLSSHCFPKSCDVHPYLSSRTQDPCLLPSSLGSPGPCWPQPRLERLPDVQHGPTCPQASQREQLGGFCLPPLWDRGLQTLQAPPSSAASSLYLSQFLSMAPCAGFPPPRPPTARLTPLGRQHALPRAGIWVLCSQDLVMS